MGDVPLSKIRELLLYLKHLVAGRNKCLVVILKQNKELSMHSTF